MDENANGKMSYKEQERIWTLQEVVEAAERAKIPLRIDRPGFTRITVDLQESFRRPIVAIGKDQSLGISNISY
ncbi:MAG: hypothetical protein AABX01_01540 [Candidatus Micrarchaeota archaeon]